MDLPEPKGSDHLLGQMPLIFFFQALKKSYLDFTAVWTGVLQCRGEVAVETSLLTAALGFVRGLEGLWRGLAGQCSTGLVAVA